VLVAAGVVFLVAWQAGTLASLGRRSLVTLAVFGFVLHIVFGKVYSLVPSYFDRELAWSMAPAVTVPLTATGTVALAVAPVDGVPPITGALGAVAGAVGYAYLVFGVFVRRARE
jgi:hypothetical protein